MCKVKEGAAVVSVADLQNLITSVILRQTSTFSEVEVCRTIHAKLNGSKYENSREVESRCKKTIATLYTINSLRSIEPDRYALAMSFPAVAKR